MFGSKIKDVGVIGLGIIGSRVAENLRKANFNVFVWNRTARAVPGFLASPHEIAEIAQTVQVFVRDSEALLEVVRDMKPALKKHHVVCVHSTVSAAAMKEAAKIVQETGAGFLDAPFTGSKVAAEKGELVYYIGGDAKELEKVMKVLEASSKKILHFGPNVGDATVLKIATNLVSGAVVGALAEALAITKAHGVEGSQLLEAFTNNANCSPLITMKLPSMMAASYEAHFSLKNMLKDAHYAQVLAKEKSVAAPVLDASAAVMERAQRAGKGDLDYSVVFENFSEPKEEPAPVPAPAPTPVPQAREESKPRKQGKSKAEKGSVRVTLKARPLEQGDATT
jgi:3-hydroxyisobutyrate dehydrogenase-like beta-hydroxyacid dehydrogenase